ncbi:hypothetical protein [Pedobacter agri]|uniref:Uncharacterized protein n=1 Tax=Pedobacter agri TaxID=454586 RepID=A0A9X3DC12_9SPHI|nr:hypothetical protein [Pedobacter agri]MCX3264844.1 hypothetical protein [Pedobacter agri]
MQNILTQQDYKNVLNRIEFLLSKGSQAISNDEIHEITSLRQRASQFEREFYDLTIPDKSLQQSI